jgi:hypothetical protein
MSTSPASLLSGFTRQRAWYFDRLGVAERCRRQVYSWSPFRHYDLYLAIVMVIECNVTPCHAFVPSAPILVKP